MHRILRIAAVSVLALASLPALALKPFTAQYSASYMGMSGTGRMSLASAGSDRWRYSLSIGGGPAQLSQVTVLQEVGDALRPLSGTDTSVMLIRRTVKNASYDWSKGEARWSGDVNADRMGPIALQNGDVDGMVLNLAIVRDVAAGKPLRYRLVDNGKARTATYAVVGREAVSVGGRSLQATKVSGDGVTLWVVPEYPVPVRISKGSDGIDLRLQSIN